MALGLFAVSLLAAYAAPAAASCAYGTSLHPRQEETVEVNTFGYSGPIGPTNWVALDPAANAVCATGRNQSPIDLVAGAFSMVPAAELSLALPDLSAGAKFENLGTTVEVIAEGGALTFAGVSYTMQQFHFHLPSEHLDSGASMAMEMHMVWESEAGEVAVVSTFIDIDDGSGGGAVVPPAEDPAAAPPAEEPVAEAPVAEAPPAEEPVVEAPVAEAPAEAPVAEAPAAISHTRRSAEEKKARRVVTREQAEQRRQLPGLSGEFFHITAPTTAASSASTLLETVLGSVGEIATPGTVTDTQPLVMTELLDTLNAGSFQTYEGSLTTPPCSEGVRWLVSDQRLLIQTPTFIGARNVIGFNSRFPQNELGQENVLSLASAPVAA